MPKQPKNNEKTDVAKKKAKKAPQKSTKSEKTAPEKPPSKKRGSPSLYNSKVKPFLEDIARYTRCGVTEGQLCEFYGVGKTQWAQYKKDNPELTETLLNAREELKTALSNRSFECAMGYEYYEEDTVITKDKSGAITGTKTYKHKRYAKADVGMLQFLLINRFPDEFARDPQAVALRQKMLELATQGKCPPDGWSGV